MLMKRSLISPHLFWFISRPFFPLTLSPGNIEYRAGEQEAMISSFFFFKLLFMSKKSKKNYDALIRKSNFYYVMVNLGQ